MPYRSRELALAEREAALEAELQALLAPGSIARASGEAIRALDAEIEETREARASARPERKRLRLVVRRASPCLREWDVLWGDDCVRRCDGCRQNVYNFSGMSSERAAALVLRERRRLPKRLYRRSDGSVVLRDCPRFHRRRIALAALGVVLGVASAWLDIVIFLGTFWFTPC